VLIPYSAGRLQVTACIVMRLWTYKIHVSEVSGDNREGSFIIQRLSVTIQRFNAALFHESFTRHDDPDL